MKYLKISNAFALLFCVKTHFYSFLFLSLQKKEYEINKGQTYNS